MTGAAVGIKSYKTRMAHQNTFAGNPLDRAGDLRNDPEWLARQEANPEAQAMVLWEGRPLIEETAERTSFPPRSCAS